MHFLLTFDVESFSFSLNKEDVRMTKLIYTTGLPRILELLAKYDIRSTFYFTGEFCEESPESVELVQSHGHEIGCHGYSHSPNMALDLLNYEQQVSEIRKAKKAIESVAGKVVSFRAPALRINKFTPEALEVNGFITDSSISSQRFDGPFSFGSKEKLKWLNAPRKPYFLPFNGTENNSNILEIPISALIIPFIGTTMRISPNAIKILRKVLYYESKKTGKPIVFLFHPNECIDINERIVPNRRTNNIIEYLFADVIRQRLKLKNLGEKSIRLLDEILLNASKKGFEFICAKDYEKRY